MEDLELFRETAERGGPVAVLMKIPIAFAAAVFEKCMEARSTV